MAVQSLTALSVFYGGYNLACRAKSFAAPRATKATLNTTSMCDEWEQSIKGLASVSWDTTVMADFDTDQLDQILGVDTSAFTSSAGQPLSVAADGTTGGEVAYTFNASTFSITPFEGAVGDVAIAAMSGRNVSGPLVRGTLMDDPSTARTSTGTGTARQLGAVSSSQRLYAALHVLSTSGTSPTLDVVIRSDDNSGMSSATDRITLTQATGITSEWASVAGAVADDYWDVEFTIGGTDPSFTFAVVLGIATP